MAHNAFRVSLSAGFLGSRNINYHELMRDLRSSNYVVLKIHAANVGASNAMDPPTSRRKVPDNASSKFVALYSNSCALEGPNSIYHCFVSEPMGSGSLERSYPEFQPSRSSHPAVPNANE